MQSSFDLRGGPCPESEPRYHHRPIRAPRCCTSPNSCDTPSPTALYIHPKFDTVSSNTPLDPAAVPQAFEQLSIFFKELPLELRWCIYEYAFTTTADDVSPLAQFTAPLPTCHQIYFEARFIAFACIDWRIDVEALCRTNDREVEGISDNS